MKKQNNLAVIILAAGKSTRMKSAIPKVLHPICGRPMLGFVLDLVRELRINRVIAVLGHKHEEVRRHLPAGIKVAVQKRLLGTADAVQTALSNFKNFQGTVLVLYADNPLLKKETVFKLLKYHTQNDLDATLLTAQLEKPSGYGRVLRDKYACVSGIVEDNDADDFQKGIKEVNTGIMCVKKRSLTNALKYVRPNNRKKEYYLTDIIGILHEKGGLVDAVKIDDSKEALGINSRSELATANAIMQKRLNEDYMKTGITIVDPVTVFISYGTQIGEDTTIYPFTVIERNVKIGKRCKIGPFAHIRPGTEIKDDVGVGNFIEIVRSKISSKSKAKHFGYIGDTRIGRFVNIGAGTVTANYDGKSKNKTVIEDHAFIGSDTVIVAPVKIGKRAATGAGSVVVKHRNVSNGTIVAGIPARVLRKQG
jgi:bifunctional UDP-N-acetylglucosamine pyrophosphorylase/glucosamine-1-phosphate N-acetyltransferase